MCGDTELTHVQIDAVARCEKNYRMICSIRTYVAHSTSVKHAEDCAYGCERWWSTEQIVTGTTALLSLLKGSVSFVFTQPTIKQELTHLFD